MGKPQVRQKRKSDYVPGVTFEGFHARFIGKRRLVVIKFAEHGLTA